DGLKRFGALTSAAHKFFASGRSVRDAALNFDADYFQWRGELRIGEKQTGDFVDGLANGCELRFASATDGDDDVRHELFFPLRVCKTTSLLVVCKYRPFCSWSVSTDHETRPNCTGREMEKKVRIVAG